MSSRGRDRITRAVVHHQEQRHITHQHQHAPSGARTHSQGDWYSRRKHPKGPSRRPLR